MLRVLKLFYFLLKFLIIVIYSNLYSQDFKQNIYGKVVDKVTGQPLYGATIIGNVEGKTFLTTTDTSGYFLLSSIPVGNISIKVTCIGYETVYFSKLLLTSAKEMQLFVEMEESVVQIDEVLIKSQKEKIVPLNEMAVVSSRAFTVEETERFAGSRGDVARMASNYAGVSFMNDQRNDLIIRGNSPKGLLWRLDDIEIPNPNHFAETGTTGGVVSMLNNNTLRNSDFYTGAFPAEFGNAISGVFDLKMRNGNYNKYEFTLQSSFNGLEAGAEGPIKRINQSSFFAYYRYSFLDFMNMIGFKFSSNEAIPRYQDFILKVNYPLKNGIIQIHSLLGNSSIYIPGESDTYYKIDYQDIYNYSSVNTVSLSYTHYLSKNSFLKFIIYYLAQIGGTDIDSISYDNDKTRIIEHYIKENKLSLSTNISGKINSNYSYKAGIKIDKLAYIMNSKYYDYDFLKLVNYLNQRKNLEDGPYLINTYLQFKIKYAKTWILPGLHYTLLTLNNSKSFEPRIAFKYILSKNQSLNFGYGLHSRMHSLSTYYYGTFVSIDNYVETNKSLKFLKAHHFVYGYDWKIKKDLYFKAETYFQYLFKIPVERKDSWYSLINSGTTWGPDTRDSLVNNGIGKNYGVEFTLEKFFNKKYYFLSTLSLYNSLYKASDNVWRNTVFNGNYIYNLLFGLEHFINKKSLILFDFKLSIAGGRRYIPIDLEKSIISGQQVYDETSIYKCQYPPFFKIDVKIGYKQNFKTMSQEYQFYIENLTDNKNILYEFYNNSTKKIHKVYQLGFFPMVLWRLNF